MIQYLIIFLLLILIGVVIYLAYKSSHPPIKDNQNDQTTIMLQNQIAQLTKELSSRLHETNQRLDQSNHTINKQLQESNKIIQQSFAISNETINKVSQSASKNIQAVTEKLTKLDQTNKQVVGFADQLHSLENILKNPKQRGILGEYFLENMLSNVLPPTQYQMQYKFNNGDTVDAVIFVKDKIIPIDAKFSLEKYNLIMTQNDKVQREKLEREFKMDIKERIDETAKYIRPQDNTTEFSFMFIPAEGVFYNLLIYQIGETKVHSKDLIEYAFTKKVIIVSPTSFFAYLQTVMQALKSLQVEESVKEIIINVNNLDRHLQVYDKFFRGVGKYLQTTVNKYNDSYKEFKKIDKDIAKITDKESKLKPLEIDSPHVD
ncbi:MAG: DNA recombination protein RmuC [Patescibacteria group bacterium]